MPKNIDYLIYHNTNLKNRVFILKLILKIKKNIQHFSNNILFYFVHSLGTVISEFSFRKLC